MGCGPSFHFSQFSCVSQYSTMHSTRCVQERPWASLRCNKSKQYAKFANLPAHSWERSFERSHKSCNVDLETMKYLALSLLLVGVSGRHVRRLTDCSCCDPEPTCPPILEVERGGGSGELNQCFCEDDGTPEKYNCDYGVDVSKTTINSKNCMDCIDGPDPIKCRCNKG